MVRLRMEAMAILIAIGTLHIVDANATPTFTLLSSRSGLLDPKTDIPQFEVTFTDGQKDNLILEHYNAMPHSKNIDPLRLCNYLGHLRNEKTARIAVTGCVDERNVEGKMYISMISKRSPYQRLFSMDLDGTVIPIQVDESNDAYITSKGYVVSRDGGEFQDNDAIGETDIEAAAEASTTNGVPYHLKITVKIGTDTSVINKIENDLGRTVDDWLAEMFTHVQNHYHHDTLQHKIDFEISGLTLDFGEELTVSRDDLRKLSRYTRDANDDNVDLYIWIVDGGRYAGMAWLGSACITGWGGFSKTSVTKGPSRSNAIVETAETLAHEVGHNLGMSHDFIAHENGVNTICRAEGDGSEKACNQCVNWRWGSKLGAQTEASGECCTGFMDYGSHPNYWSDCSVRMFEQHYVSENWVNCIPEVCSNDLPCLNGGTCVDGSCSCPSGITGFRCEIAIQTDNGHCWGKDGSNLVRIGYNRQTIMECYRDVVSNIECGSGFEYNKGCVGWNCGMCACGRKNTANSDCRGSVDASQSMNVYTITSVDCEWGDWVEGDCSATCGTGQQTNTRTKLVKEAYGGKCTGGFTDVASCLVAECPVDCEWGDWVEGYCSTTCGAGEQTNTRTKLFEEAHGGQCTGGFTDVTSCHVAECPDACYSSDTKYTKDPVRGIKNFHIKGITSLEDCQEECVKDPDCNFFTWNSPDFWKTNRRNTCWLKAGKGIMKKDCGKGCTGTISGPKICDDGMYLL